MRRYLPVFEIKQDTDKLLAAKECRGHAQIDSDFDVGLQSEVTPRWPRG